MGTGMSKKGNLDPNYKTLRLAEITGIMSQQELVQVR
jgi:hypothetical protein